MLGDEKRIEVHVSYCGQPAVITGIRKEENVHVIVLKDAEVVIGDGDVLRFEELKVTPHRTLFRGFRAEEDASA